MFFVPIFCSMSLPEKFERAPKIKIILALILSYSQNVGVSGKGTHSPTYWSQTLDTVVGNCNSLYPIC